jgi:hypothetical protein
MIGHRKACLWGLFLLFALGLLSCEQKADVGQFDLKKHPWCKWKVGTYARYRLTIREPAKQDRTVGWTIRLESAGHDSFTLLTTSRGGNEASAVSEIELFPQFETEETVTVGEESLPCTVWSAQGKKETFPTLRRYWLDEQGRILKVSYRQQRQERYEHELTAVAFNEEVRVAGSPFRCTRMEGTVWLGDRTAQVKQWWSPELPGFVARAETLFEMNGDRLTIQRELVDFGESDPLQDAPPPPE